MSNNIEGPAPDSDESLLADSLARNPEAFSLLVTRYEERLYQFIWRLVRNDHVAEDIFQETWLKAFAARAGFRGRSKFSTWIFSIALNLVRGWWKRNKEKNHLSLESQRQGKDGAILRLNLAELVEDPAPSALDFLLGRERRQKMEKALARMPQAYREVLILVYQEGLSYEEAGRLLKKNKSNVKVLRFRALKKLKEMLG